jgi:hypothetical protein
MKNKILNSAKTVLVLGAMLGLVSFGTTYAQSGGLGTGLEVKSDAGTMGDPCGGVGGAGGSWTAPSSAPTAGNVAAPINVSGSDQYKDGKLTLGTMPCPLPAAGWTPGSKLTVNGVTDTNGFANWGSSFLQGFVSIGAKWTGTPTPNLYVKNTSATGGAAAVFGGGVGIRGNLGVAQNDGSIASTATGAGFNTIYVQSIPVCLENGTNCPKAPAGSGGWAATGSDMYNTNSGNVLIGTSTKIYPNKLFVSGTTRLGGDVDYGSANVLSVAPGTVNFDAPGVVGGRLSINPTSGEVKIGGNLKVGGQSVCRQDGTNCPMMSSPSGSSFNLYMVLQGANGGGTPCVGWSTTPSGTVSPITTPAHSYDPAWPGTGGQVGNLYTGNVTSSIGQVIQFGTLTTFPHCYSGDGQKHNNVFIGSVSTARAS